MIASINDCFVAVCLIGSAVVGEIDEEVDAELQLEDVVAEPLKPVVH